MIRPPFHHIDSLIFVLRMVDVSSSYTTALHVAHLASIAMGLKRCLFKIQRAIALGGSEGIFGFFEICYLGLVGK